MSRPRREYKRRNKIPKPGLQLRLVGIFLGISALSFLLYTLMLGMQLSTLASELPEGGEHLQERLPSLLGGSLALACAVLLPLIFAVGVSVTFRVAGPLYRLERQLRLVAQGEQVEPVRLRSGDELSDLADAVNAAVRACGRELEPGGDRDEAPAQETLRRKAG
jgi:methyl-accepting chemotaxis protein